ncbi:MAG TPA: L-threonine 3-dehydrogenase [Candidatus Eisenbacteria bacterium]|jgi:threonine 3-dehydrogenase|nr:L-threonine 3-dehydrogenase [Candidatus Eisenbacteria bacterium]
MAVQTKEPLVSQDTMWAIQKPGPAPGLARIVAPIPKVGPKDVRVRVTAFAICGTDLHIVEWDDWAASRIKPPLIPGHEFTGVVESVGSEVTLVRPGDRVTAETHIYCGLCYACRRGLPHLCENVQILGVDRQGAFADLVVIPEQNVWKLHPSIPEEIAAVHDPLGNAVHCALAGPVAGLRFAVFGCGPIGCFSVGVLKASGASWVAAVDKNPMRLGLAERMGADLLLNVEKDAVVPSIRDATDGRGVDAMLEMSGSPGAFRDGFEALANGGRISLLGIPSKPLEIDVAREIIFRGATVQGINGRWIYDTWFRMEALLLSGKLDIRPVITHTLGWSEFDRAVELQRSGKAGKIVLQRDHP